jgi:8-oxo-dGTP pyrophosphatase MutT (NUDIX family)
MRAHSTTGVNLDYYATIEMMRKVAIFGVGALIYTPDGRYLMQLRDDEPNVSMRGYWGLFGGSLEEGEDPRTALARELHEELRMNIEAPATAFTELIYSLRFASSGIHRKAYFEVPVEEQGIHSLRLGEGQRMALHTLGHLIALPNVIPWDLFGVIMHARRTKIREVIVRTPGGM